MEKNILIWILTIILLSSFAFATLQSEQTTYYKSDTNGDFPDATGSYADGTIIGATYTSSGKINGAYNYDGNDYVALDSEIKFPSNGDFSFNAWVKSASTVNPVGNENIINVQQNSGSNEAGFYFNNQGQIVGRLRDTDGTDWEVVTSTDFYDATYHMITYVFNYNNENVSIYVDGDFKNSVEHTGSYDGITITSPMLIGAFNDKGAPITAVGFFNGDIDEFGYWNNTALNSTQITQLYNSGNGLQYPYNKTGKGLEPTDNLISRYYLNDSNQNGNVTLSNNVDDSWGSNNGQAYGYSFNHGTNNGAIYVNSNATGLNNTGSALEFDGVNDYVNLGTTTKLDISSSNTYCTHLNLESGHTDHHEIFSKYSFRVWVNEDSGTITVGKRIGGVWETVTSSGSINFDSNEYLCIVYNNSKIDYYFNGIYSDSDTVGIIDNGNSQNFCIGSNGCSADNVVLGNLDEVKIFNRALSQEEIVQEMNATGVVNDGIVAYYDFNEKTGTKTYDNNHLGQGVTNFNPSNRAFNFDGVDDYVSITNNINIIGNQSRTMSFWAKANDLELGSMIGWGSSTGTGKWFYSKIDSDGTWFMNLYGVDWDTNIIANTNWNHHIIHYNETDLTWYINGESIGSTTVNLATENAPLGIGYRNSGSSQFFNGSIDNVRIYNRSLSEQEIKTLYYGGLQNTFNLFAIYSNVNNFQAYVNSILYETEEAYLVTNERLRDESVNIQTSFNSFINTQNDSNTLNNSLNINFPVINITMLDFYNNVSIDNFSINFINSFDNYNEDFDTTTGNITKRLTKRTYQITANSFDYYIQHPIEIIDLENNTNLEFIAYQNGDLPIEVRDSSNNNIITENITIRIQDGVTETTDIIVNGSDYIENLVDGTSYVMIFNTSGYGSNVYNINYQNELAIETQIVYLDLSNTTEQVLIEVTDEAGVRVEGVTVSARRYINGTLTTVSLKSTDVTGQAIFDLLITETHEFIISKSGYKTKTIQVNPILASSYSFPLEKSSDLDLNGYTSGVEINIDPQEGMLENKSYLFNFSISSLENLDYYGFILYDGSNIITNQLINTKPNGGTETFIANFTGELNNSFIFTYYYKKDNYAEFRTSIYYQIKTVDQSNGTLEQIRESFKTIPMKQRVLFFVVAYIMLFIVCYEISIKLGVPMKSILLGVLALMIGVAYLVAIPIIPISLLSIIIAFGLVMSRDGGGLE